MMEGFDISPDEAVKRITDLVGIIEMPVPEDYQAKMAAFMLIVADICKGNCSCESCQRTRDIFENV